LQNQNSKTTSKTAAIQGLCCVQP